jgi:hypothetical protein
MGNLDGYSHFGEPIQGINQYYSSSGTTTNTYHGWGYYTVPSEPFRSYHSQEFTIEPSIIPPTWTINPIDKETMERMNREAAQIADGWDPDENL